MSEDIKKNNLDNSEIILNLPKLSIPPEEEFNVFKKKISFLIGLNLFNYKNTQMERRIVSLMNRNNIFKLDEYYQLLSSSKEKLDEFINMLTINVTEFFRNNDKFDELEQKFIPELLKKHGSLKIWSAGCSCGAEIYSIAMILDRLKVLDKCTLVASDFDINILNRAKKGHYSKFELGVIRPEYKNYFKPLDDKGEKFQVDPNLTQKVKFERRDLLNGTFEKNFNLILCRNVVIYFTEEAKDKLYSDFYNSLSVGGILLIGSTERIHNYKEIGYNLLSSFFYQK
jgi:chemotaxis protein methyltransferase CheR